MADYWCETCEGKRLKSITSLVSHLRFHHSIQVYMRRMDYMEYFPSFPYSQRRKDLYRCIVCSEEFLNRVKATNHSRTHLPFFCEGKQFRNLQSLLHYIDQKHAIHIGYVKGVARKVLFLDGITKEKSKT